MSFKLNKIFSNGVVFQRNAPIRIFGTGTDGEIVYILFKGILLNKEIKKGKFLIEFPAFDAECDLSLLAFSDENKVIINDICIGEVFLAAGQSNMEFLLKYEKNFRSNKKIKRDSKLRYFDVFKKTYNERENIKELQGKYNKWKSVDNSNDLENFSAVSYYFLTKLREFIDVPIAVIGCNYGGSSASSWIKESKLKNNNLLKIYLDEYLEATSKLNVSKYKRLFKEKDKRSLKNKKIIEFNDRVAYETVKFDEVIAKLNALDDKEKEYFYLPIGPYDPKKPGILYENMLKEIIPFNFKGVIYYQGESDENHADIYFELFKALVNSRREEFNNKMPFFTVMLAPFKERFGNLGLNYPLIREAQWKASKEIEDVFVTNVMDDGEEYDIHPKNKKIVGERLATLVYSKLYDPFLLSSGPTFRDIEIHDNCLTINFDNAGDGLRLDDDYIKDLYINGDDVNNMNFSINQNSIDVDLTLTTSKTLEIEYLYKDYTKCNLYNSNNLPAFPFREKIVLSKD